MPRFVARAFIAVIPRLGQGLSGGAPSLWGGAMGEEHGDDCFVGTASTFAGGKKRMARIIETSGRHCASEFILDDRQLRPSQRLEPPAAL